MKKIFIGGLIVLIGLGIFFIANKEKSFGGPVMLESYIFQNQDANFASISYDGGTDEIITEAAHGLIVGDAVVFYSAVSSVAFGGNDAPGFTESTRYFVATSTTSYAFEVSTTQSGTVLDLTVASAGGGEFVYELIKGRAFPVESGNTFVYSFCGDTTASAAVQFVGSIQTTEPDFYAARGTGNRYDALDVYDLQSASSIDGDTGVSIDESADCKLYQVFANGLKWISAIFTSFGEGNVDIQLQVTN